MKTKLILHTYILYPKLRAVQYVPNKILNIPIFPNIPKTKFGYVPDIVPEYSKKLLYSNFSLCTYVPY